MKSCVANPKRTPYDLAMDSILENCCDSTTQELIRGVFGGPDRLDGRHFTKIHEIVLGRNGSNLAQYLRSNSRAQIDQGDWQGRTPLSWAAARGDLDVVKILMDLGADLNIVSCAGLSPLHYAVCNKRPLVLKYLLEHGADIERREAYFQHSPLLVACHQPVDDPLPTRLLITAGANVNARRFDGATPLMVASMRNSTTIMKLIMEQNVDIDCKDADGQTALLNAIRENSHKAINLLLSSGASVTVSSTDRSTILHIAARRSDLETLCILARANFKGLDIDHEDSKGMTPLQYARQRIDEPPEWYTAFAHLLASVRAASSCPGAAEFSSQKESSKPERRIASGGLASGGLAMLQRSVSHDVQQIYQYLIHLPRPPIAIVRALAVLSLLAWYIAR